MAGIPENAMQNSDPEIEKDQKASEPSKPPANLGFLAEGIFSWDVEGAEIGESSLFSPYHTIGGARFRLGCKIESRGRSLVANLYCNDDVPKKTDFIKVAYTLKMLTRSSKGCTGFAPFDERWQGWKASLNARTDSKNGNILNGRFTIEVQIKVIYYYNQAFFDFTCSDPLLSNVTLIVEGKKFHASKMFLAHVSGYFKALFCSDFAEKNKDEIELGEIRAKDFEEMLHFIFPQRKQVTAYTVAALLRMADFFDVPTLRKECEEFRHYSPELDEELAVIIELLSLSDGWNIEWAVTVDAIETDFVFSPHTIIDGLPFRLGCRTETTNNKKWLVIGLFCDCANKMFYAGVDYQLVLDSFWHPWSKDFKIPFHQAASSHMCRFTWAYAVDPKTSRVQDGCFNIKARIKVLSSCKNDFVAPDSDLSDVTLLVGGRAIPANKFYLAHYSGYFKARCTENASECMEMTELENIDPDEFEEMLAAIYPQRKKVSAATVVALLRMAEFFDVQVLVKECTEYLKSTDDFSRDAKLKLTGEFCLPDLHYCLMERIQCNNQLHDVVTSAAFGQFSVSLKRSILAEYFKLYPERFRLLTGQPSR